jgi:hypothetical protein
MILKAVMRLFYPPEAVHGLRAGTLRPYWGHPKVDPGQPFAVLV